MHNVNLTQSTETSDVNAVWPLKRPGAFDGGVVAGPLYVIVALSRPHRRVRPAPSRRQPVEQRSLGWIQITNFLLTGLLVIAGASGMRRP